MIVVVLGGTGTLGNALLPILSQDKRITRIRVLSRGEHKQMDMERKHPEVDFFIGDVRDYTRIEDATMDADIVVHAAAVKSVDKAEYDPLEAIKTNVGGTENVVRACKKNNVDKAMFISTDKAVAPSNIYGASKLVAERLWVQEGNKGSGRAKFSAVRYGNVFASQGSVIERWKEQRDQGKPLTLTCENMTRFFITPENAGKFVYRALNEMQGAETFIPKMYSTSMVEMVTMFKGKDQKYETTVVGRRPGEKMHEVLISHDEVDLITEEEWCYIRWPSHHLFPVPKRGKKYEGKEFTSYNATRFLLEELEELCLQS